jgi:hypothetical protein
MRSRRSRLGWLAVAALLAGAVGCSDQKSAYSTTPEQTNEAEDFWAKIHAQAYRGWNRAPGYPTRTASNAPHGDSVDVYVNTVIATTLTSGLHPTAWPQGSIVVKDGFADGAQTLVAAMEKRQDGWFWAEYRPDGAVLASGRPAACTGCHASGSDYIRAFQLP